MDGRVSLEVDPRIAKDQPARTVAEARALWWMVDRPNLFIKIPATPEGLPAITQCLAEGISVNVTLIFSLTRYGEVIDAFFAGLEKAAAAGLELPAITSVASFFVSRVDSEVDRRLDKIGTPQAAQLRGKAAIANARLAYELYEQRFSEPRWEALARGGRTPAATALGIDKHQGSRVRRHALCRRACRAWRGQHDARVDHRRSRRPRRTSRRHDPRRLTKSRARSSPISKSLASDTTTSRRCSRPRAWRSSRPRGPNCSPRSRRR